MLRKILRRRKPAAAESEPRFLVEQAAVLLAPHQRLVASIRAIVAVPPRHWNALYQPMFEAFASLVQRLPASEAHHHAGPGGLLRHSLEVVLEALKQRRTLLLPSGAPAEEVARQQDAWTYACVSGALLHDVGKPLSDQTITVIRNGQPQAWSPVLGPMPAGATYKVAFNRDRRHRRHERIPSLLVHLVVPAAGLQWLIQEAELFNAWLALLHGDGEDAGPLGRIIDAADGLSSARDLAGEDRVQLPTARSKPLSARLLAGLRQLIDTESLPLNRPGAAAFYDSGSLWLVSKRVLDALREHLVAEGQTGIPSRNDRLMDELQQNRMLMANGDRAVWSCAVTIGDWSQRLSCLRVDANRIWSDPEALPAALAGSVTPLVEADTDPANPGEPAMRRQGAGAPLGDPPVPVRALEAPPAAEGLGAQEEHEQVLPLPPLAAAAPPPSARKQVPEPDEPISAPNPAESADLGVQFVDWLKENISSRRVEINSPRARLHVVYEGLALVSPGIFRDFSPDRWAQVQKRFQRLGLHLRTPEETNIWTCQVVKNRKRSTISVLLIPDPERRLGVPVPAPNPAVRLLGSGGGN